MRWILWAAAWAALGCDDGAGSGADATVSADATRAPRADVEVTPVDAGLADLGPGDQGAPDATLGECVPGERACLEEGGRGYRACSDAGAWVLDRCGDTEICRGGQCIDDPRQCRPGSRVCLDATTPGDCEPGEGYVAAEPCPEGLVCAGTGRCLTPECAGVEGARSYLGCDYLAVDLPNITWAPLGGTPDSPLGVVVANPDLAHPARVTVHDAEGRIAPLVAEVEVAPPIVAAGTPPVTVRTELWGGDRQVSDAGFDRAEALEIAPGGMAVLLLAHHGYGVGSRVRRQAWRVSADRPVAAYQFGPYCCSYSFSNDASLLLPVPTLGREYVAVGVPAWQREEQPDPEQPQPAGGGISATLTVVAPEADTRVTVTLPPGVRVLPDADGRVIQQGQQVQLLLGANEVADLLSEPPGALPGQAPVGMDFTGARVEADKPVAVFSGHECTFVPQDQEACDHVEEQLLPTDTWGARFALVPPILRTRTPQSATEATYWKIVALQPGARVQLSRPFAELDARPPGFVGVPDCADMLTDPQTLVLEAPGHCEFATRAAVQVEADGPISVMGAISGQATTGIQGAAFGAHAGDPAIFLLPPESQYRLDYAFLAPGTYFNDYVTVIAPLGTAVAIDGVMLDFARGQPVPGTDQMFVHVRLEDGPHRAEGDRPFGIIVFAFDDYVSYAFTGGLNLNKR